MYADTAVKLVAIFLVALLLSIPAIQAQDISTPAGTRVAQSSESRQVWVDKATGVYHNRVRAGAAILSRASS